MRNGGEAAKLDAADAGGLAWTAVGLKVTHPDRPHRLALKIKGGEPSALGVALVESSGAGAGAATSPARLLLDACASGPPILRDGPAASFDWVVFPHSAEMVLVMVNRSPEAEVRAGAITLSEIEELAAAPQVQEPAARALGLYLTGSDCAGPVRRCRGLKRPAANRSEPRQVPGLLRRHGGRRARRPGGPGSASGPLRAGRRRSDRPGPTRNDPADPGSSRMCALAGAAASTGPDSLPGLPAADSAEALRRGLVRIDSQGRPDGPAYHPLNPEVREAMKQRVTEALAQLKAGEPGPGGGGLVIRLGPGPTLLGTPDTGLDDATYRKFTHDTFGPETTRSIPGVESTDPDRFAVRSRYLAGVGRMPWLTWRSKEIAALYAELNAAVRAIAPGGETRRGHAQPGRRAGGQRGQARRSSGPAALSVVAKRRARSPNLAERPGLAAGPARNGPLDRGAFARPGHQPRPRLAGGLAPASRLAPLDRRRSGRDRCRWQAPDSPAPDSRSPQSALTDSLPSFAGRSGPAARGQLWPWHAKNAGQRAGLADRAAPGRRPGRRRAARARTRCARCAVGLPGRKGRVGPGRTAAPLRAGAARPSGQGSTRRPTGRRHPQAVRRRGAES